jgi:hypothetical protein
MKNKDDIIILCDELENCKKKSICHFNEIVCAKGALRKYINEDKDKILKLKVQLDLHKNFNQNTLSLLAFCVSVFSLMISTMVSAYNIRPIDKYKADVPEEIWKDLNGCEPIKDWVYWFFTFEDNISMTPEKIEQKKMSYPPGTKIYKNKILGLRGKATGLVFSNFCKRHVITKEQAKVFIKQEYDDKQTEWFVIYTSGLDTAYSTKSPDTIAMSFMGITNKGKLIVLDEKVYNNAALDIPIAPSDTVKNYIDFLERNRKEWGGMAKNTFIDNADQATITEFAKYKREHHECLYIFNNAYKKVTIIDRINLQLGWMSFNDEKGKEPSYYVVDTCTNYTGELQVYSWLEDKDCEPEDGNDHMVNSTQYGWIPYRDKVGVENG